MSKSNWLPLFAAIAVVALAAGGPRPAEAVEVFFGDITPSSGLGTAPACTNFPGDNGHVCGNGQTFTAQGGTFTATGFSGQFATATALTWKSNTSPINNGLEESGLGENAVAPQNPAQACSDGPSCEADAGTSVAVRSTIRLTDVIIGSVQDPERFEIFASTTQNGPLTTQINSTFQQSSCTHFTGTTETCVIDLTGGTFFAVGLHELAGVGGNSDALLTAVSVAVVPAPLIGHGLLVLLAVGGVLFGGEFLKRRTSLAA